jgi:hypothetical protein
LTIAADRSWMAVSHYLKPLDPDDLWEAKLRLGAR